jgi:hypothetical protein
MAKAHIKTTDGVSVKLEGTPAEIAAVLKEVQPKPKSGTTGKANAKMRGGKTTISRLVDELKNEGFFKKTKTLSDIRRRLGDMGHSYPLTGLSGPMRKEVRKKRLRRFKEKGKYVYAQ